MISFFIGALAIASTISECNDGGYNIPAAPTARDARWEVVARAREKLLSRDRGGIVVIGDSIAARWPVNLQVSQFGRRFVNLGIGGDRTENVTFRMGLYDLKRAAPPAVVIIVGTNDLRTAASPQAIAENIFKIARWTRTSLPSTPVFVSELLPRGRTLTFKDQEIRCINRALHSHAKQIGYTVLDVHDIFAREAGPVLPGSIYADMVHPNEAGYRIISRQLKLALSDRNRDRRKP